MHGDVDKLSDSDDVAIDKVVVEKADVARLRSLKLSFY